MASNQTEHYGLNQWEAGDKVLRTEFNGDNAKIDGALAVLAEAVAGKAEAGALSQAAASIPKLVAGSFTGDGAESRVVSLPFTPKAVLLFSAHGQTTQVDGHTTYCGGLALTGAPVTTAATKRVVLAVVTRGFQVGCFTASSSWNDYIFTNQNNTSYYYLALG